jgi:hypothetical protein
VTPINGDTHEVCLTWAFDGGLVEPPVGCGAGWVLVQVVGCTDSSDGVACLVWARERAEEQS